MLWWQRRGPPAQACQTGAKRTGLDSPDGGGLAGIDGRSGSAFEADSADPPGRASDSELDETNGLELVDGRLVIPASGMKLDDALVDEMRRADQR